ncbi:MAG: hypothetical protein WC260_01525 [Candidatus Pacearchaeota archaeon]
MRFENYYYENDPDLIGLNESHPFDRWLGGVIKGAMSKATKLAGRKIKQALDSRPINWKSNDIKELREVDEYAYQNISQDLSNNLINNKALKDEAKPYPKRVTRAIYKGDENDFERLKDKIVEIKTLDKNDLVPLTQNDVITVFELDLITGGWGKIFLIDLYTEDGKTAPFIGISKTAENYYKDVHGMPFKEFVRQRKTYSRMGRDIPKKKSPTKKIELKTKQSFGYQIISEPQYHDFIQKLNANAKTRGEEFNLHKDFDGMMFTFKGKEFDRVFVLEYVAEDRDESLDNYLIVFDGESSFEKALDAGIDTEYLGHSYKVEWQDSISLDDLLSLSLDTREKIKKDMGDIKTDKVEDKYKKIPITSVDWEKIINIMSPKKLESISFSRYVSLLKENEKDELLDEEKIKQHLSFVKKYTNTELDTLKKKFNLNIEEGIKLKLKIEDDERDLHFSVVKIKMEDDAVEYDIIITDEVGKKLEEIFGIDFEDEEFMLVPDYEDEETEE